MGNCWDVRCKFSTENLIFILNFVVFLSSSPFFFKNFGKLRDKKEITEFVANERFTNSAKCTQSISSAAAVLVCPGLVRFSKLRLTWGASARLLYPQRNSRGCWRVRHSEQMSDPSSASTLLGIIIY